MSNQQQPRTESELGTAERLKTVADGCKNKLSTYPRCQAAELEYGDVFYDERFKQFFEVRDVTVVVSAVNADGQSARCLYRVEEERPFLKRITDA